MHDGNATFPQRFFPGLLARRLRFQQLTRYVLFLFLFGLFQPQIAVAHVAEEHQRLTISSEQSAPNNAPTQAANSLSWVYVLPSQVGAITLQTHTADLDIVEDAGSGSMVRVKALFRLKNATKNNATTFVRISTLSAAALPADLTISVDDNEPNLQPLTEGGYQLPVQLASEGRLDIELSYSIPLLDSFLQSISYPVATLAAWQSAISLRVNIDLPPSIPSESWVKIAPDDWRFTTDSAAPAIKWLFEGSPPETPFMLLFIRPIFWQEITKARQAVITGGAGDFLLLGDLYLDLMTTASNLASPSITSPTEKEALQQGFYAQALAAYNAGIYSLNTDPVVIGELQIRLAQLYRTRIIDGQGLVYPEYARLTLDATTAALAALPAEDQRRAELARWRADGLSVLVNDARARQDWNGAIQLLEDLNKTLAAEGDVQFVTQARRQLLVQQALQLLETGNRSAAIAIAGDEIGRSELQPPAEMVSLFASWQMTVNISGQTTTLTLIGLPQAERAQAAETLLRTLVDVWQTRSSAQGVVARLSTLAASNSIGDNTSSPLQIEIEIPAQARGVSLAEVTPLTPDWALLRSLLGQLDAQSEQTSNLFHQRITLRQPIDLRTAAEQWNTAAANLEQRATAFEAQAATATSEDSAETRLRTRIQAASYREAAHIWSNLVRNSTVILTLQASNGLQDQARTWLVTPASPAQTLEFQANTLNWGRVFAALALVGVVIFLLSGLLWWLL